MTSINYGVQGATRKNDTELLKLMRRVVEQNPDSLDNRAWLVRQWRIMLDAELRGDAIDYAGYNILQRVLLRKPPAKDTKDTKDTKGADDTKDAKGASGGNGGPAPDIGQFTKEIIEKHIMAAAINLWTWRVPTVGKVLPDCTFAELEQAAPITGRFLARLSREGAPGALVREVFPNERALQGYFKDCQ